ncbi:hypothetical protein [Pantoea sp. FN0307]|uniref:hypothetical protein n=1 Tax=Pantoea sp. FN0307 TaxID=3418560 RepID=UPI003CF220FE
MYDGGFCVISTNATLPKEALPFYICDDYVIAASTDLEMNIFEDNLKDAGYFSRTFVPFGSEKKIIVHDGDKHTHWEHAEKSNIYLLKFRNFNKHIHEINYAGSLMSPKLRFTMQTIYSDETETSICARSLSSYSDLTLMTMGSHEDRAEYTQEQLIEFKDIFLKLINLNSKSRYKGILQLFYGIDSIPRQSNLLTLSYFSTLEALLTNGRTAGESITNQLIYKTQLLLNMSGTVDHQHLFNGLNYGTLWKKLYQLRSDIAHGNEIDFKKTLSPLKDIDTVNIYLDMVIQKLLRFSLNHPEMVDDLKKC